MTIGRLNAVYLVPASHPSPESLRARLDPVLRDAGPALCAQMLGATFADDPALWLIRRLDVDLALDVGAVDDERITRAWGERVARHIADRVERGADGEDVLRFPNRAVFLAQFAYDLAQGRAWTRWYYRAFDGLRHLPASAALREALTRDATLLLPALDELATTQRLGPVLDTLSAADAARVYAACLGLGGAAAARSERELVDLVLDAWDEALGGDQTARPLPHRALQLWTTLVRRAPRAARDGRIGAVIDHTLGWAALSGRVWDDAAFRAELAAGNLRGAASAARARGIEEGLEHLGFMHQAAGGDVQWLARSADRLRSPARGESTGANVSGTPLGGLFLLLPALAATGMAGVLETAPLPNPEGWRAGEALRYLVAVKCLGRARAPGALMDGVLAPALGLGRAPGFDELAGLSAAAGESGNRAAQGLMIQALRERGRAAGRWLSANVVDSQYDGRVLLVRDLEEDAWLCAEPAGSGASAALTRALDTVEAATGFPPQFLLVEDAELALELASKRPELVVAPQSFPGATRLELGPGEGDEPRAVWTNDPAGLDERARTAVRAARVRTRPLAAELDYFALAGLSAGIVENPAFDLTLTLVARAVVRAFAGGLMGFQHSGPEHLYQNFLAGMASVRMTPAGVWVKLAPRPLQLILNLAGYHGLRYSVPWLDAPVELEVQRE